MPERRKSTEDRRAAQAEPAGVCKHCQKPAYKAADGSLRHDTRAADEGAGGDGGAGDREPDKKPKRDHALHRKIGG